MKKRRMGWLVVWTAGLLVGLSGCATLERAYQEEVTWTIAPVVTVTTNAVVVTNVVPQVVEQVRMEWMTNAGTGAVTSAVVREPVATNLVEVRVTNWVARYETNGMPVRVTNWVARPEVLATIGAAGRVTNTFLPGVGSLAALVLGGLYHGYRQVRNRRVNEALVQGVETARAILTTTPQGQAADAALVKWLMSHQQEAGVFTTIATLVTEVSDNPAAREAAREILARTQRAGG